MRDYARTYGLPTVVMRQSCIYGPHQLGIEDQGWVAWFVIAAVLGKPITIYGDGKQVRDVLFVEDLLDAYDAAIAHRETAAGEIFNIGGGPTNTMSIWAEFGQYLQELLGQEVPVQYSDWRVGDQRLYVSDIRKAQKELEWTPTYDIRHGLQRLYDWVMQNKALFI
jgi:CDP-paratose 2-epimerase